MMPVLSLDHVRRGFWRGSIRVDVLRDVSLELEAGMFVAVWGRLGSGKTTLLKLAAGVDAPEAGEVRFEGKRFAAMSRREIQQLRRHEIGFARRTGPFEHELSALEYVGFPLVGTMRRNDAERRAMDELLALGLEQGCAGLVWEQLTDGERALLSIARAVVREPKLLLVDDPTSSLGAEERERTVALLRRFAVERRMAVLMTAPDLEATLGAHEVFTLTSGELHAVGRPDGGSVVRLPGA
jgi:putative ABC transport system ATP-binding protein